MPPQGSPGHRSGGQRTASMPARLDQSALREGNLALVARTVFAAPTDAPLSRADVAAATSMTRSTVSRLVDDLVAGGVLSELDPPTRVGPGRPATPLVPGSRFAALGIQANTSYLAATVLDLRGTVLASGLQSGSYVQADPASTLVELSTLCATVLAQVPPDVTVIGAGLALPGIVTRQTGELMLAPNLGWSELHLDALFDPGLPRLSDGGRQPIRVGNEADLAALSVAQPAPGRTGALADFIYLSGEIGIGGALVMDGRLMTGRNGWAGEIGHVCVDPHGPACPCGSTGCLERYAGKMALLDAAGLPHTSSPDNLARLAESGDARASRALDQATWALSIALAGVINTVDIQAVVLGGHLTQIGEAVGPDLEAALRSRVLSARWAHPSIHTPSGDPAPGATGAALAGLADVLEHPARWIDPPD